VENVIYLELFKQKKKQERDKRLFDIDACLDYLEKTHTYLNTNPINESIEVNHQIKKAIGKLKKVKEDI
jgi:hypothetical protein